MVARWLYGNEFLLKLAANIYPSFAH
ncbi:hypothetical protein PTD2_06050 [Pseudoalteromonas tunicata D2]|uniref:Uncharacterized protein n=1 Tax=Pseudoalteromonas tunicata D2 TaxID=87626 RepID=A4CE18_9GAMM|nr:hypothetical protein PTD2_06050 [Pseudoalteromonas tunicata D2]